MGIRFNLSLLIKTKKHSQSLKLNNVLSLILIKIIFLGRKLILVLYLRKVKKFHKGLVTYLLPIITKNYILLLQINNFNNRIKIKILIVCLATTLLKSKNHKKLLSKKLIILLIKGIQIHYTILFKCKILLTTKKRHYYKM